MKTKLYLTKKDLDNYSTAKWSSNCAEIYVLAYDTWRALILKITNIYAPRQFNIINDLETYTDNMGWYVRTNLYTWNENT